MNIFLKPIIYLMNNLKYSQKFSLIALLSLIIIIIVSVVMSPVDRYAEMKEAKLNVNGISQVNAMVTLMKNVQEYRQNQDLFRNGNQNLKDKILVQKSIIAQQIEAINNSFSSDKKFHNQFNSNSWENFKENWKIISADQSLGAEANPYALTIVNLRDSIIATCDNYHLSYDSKPESYYLGNNICRHLPNFSEDASQIKLITTNAIHNKAISNEDKDILWSNKFLMNDLNIVTITKNSEKIIKLNHDLNDSLSPLLSKMQNGTTAISNVLDESIKNGELNLPQQDFIQQVDGVLNATFEFYTISMKSLKNIYQKQYEVAKKYLYADIIFLVLSTLFILYFYIGMYVSTVREMSKLVAGSERIAKGDLSTKVELQTKDELSQVAFSFNEMRDILEKFIIEMQEIVINATKGNLSKNISLENKQGFSKELSLTINQMTETYQSIINEILRVLNALSQGDLTVRIEQDYEGTFAELKMFINATTDSLKNLISNIKSSTLTIDEAAREVAKGSSDLAKRTEQQATFIEETSASIEELTMTVKQNADNAKQANQLALSASDVATKGGEIIGKVIITMNTISDGAKKVSDIISVIDGIAFQTNILALNAAVEAARAGEQGRGFAVVAMEVRNLAQRASSAAKEIKDLITSSVENVANGAKLVDQAGKTMESIVSEVRHVTEIMGEIATASVEQSTGIEQVNVAMSQMDQVTEKNMLLVENEAKAAESLQEQTNHMEEFVKVFKLEDNHDNSLESTQIDKKNEINKINIGNDIKINKVLKDKDTWDKF